MLAAGQRGLDELPVRGEVEMRRIEREIQEERSGVLLAEMMTEKTQRVIADGVGRVEVVGRRAVGAGWDFVSLGSQFPRVPVPVINRARSDIGPG